MLCSNSILLSLHKKSKKEIKKTTAQENMPQNDERYITAR